MMYKVDSFLGEPYKVSRLIADFLNEHSIGMNKIVNIQFYDDNYAVMIWYDDR